jgi:hypothetical protein
MVCHVLHCRNTDLFSKQGSDTRCEVLILVCVLAAVIGHVADMYQHISRACCLYRALAHAQPQSQLSLPCIIYNSVTSAHSQSQSCVHFSLPYIMYQFSCLPHFFYSEDGGSRFLQNIESMQYHMPGA